MTNNAAQNLAKNLLKIEAPLEQFRNKIISVCERYSKNEVFCSLFTDEQGYVGFDGIEMSMNVYYKIDAKRENVEMLSVAMLDQKNNLFINIEK